MKMKGAHNQGYNFTLSLRRLLAQQNTYLDSYDT